MSVSVEWLEDWTRISASAGSALDRAHQPSLFDRIDWYRLLARHLFTATPPRVLRASDSGGEAWLFLIDDGRGRGRPLACWYSLDWGPIFAGTPNPSHLLAALLGAAARRYDRLALHPLDGARADLIAVALEQAGWWQHRHLASTNWTIDLAGRSFDDYWRARPARLRNTVGRKGRRSDIRIEIARTADPETWRAYEEVYAASWKPAEGSLPFLRALAEQEASAGSLRLGLARDAGGRPIAAQLWLVENGTATIHKLAHRADATALSPGTLLSHAMFRAAIDEDKVARIDFGLGDDAYKADWMEAAAPIYRIEAFRQDSLRGLAGIARHRLGRLVEGWRRG